MTDNGTAYIVALDWLQDKYGIRHIRISAYNLQANGIIKRQHRTICESIFKACNGNNSSWPTVASFAFWADRATTCRSTGHSPFFMAHRVEPILPFDIIQATFLVPDLTQPLSTEDLLATHARQLQKCPTNLATIHDCITASCYTSICQFEKCYENTIRDFNFVPGSLVLVCNSSLTMDKMKPQYLGPMIVIWHTCNGTYQLGKLDGAVLWLHYAAFRLIPYHTHSPSYISVMHVMDGNDLASHDDDDTSGGGAGSSSDESTREG